MTPFMNAYYAVVLFFFNFPPSPFFIDLIDCSKMHAHAGGKYIPVYTFQTNLIHSMFCTFLNFYDDYDFFKYNYRR